MFNFLKSKKAKATDIYSVVEGKLKNLSEVSDPLFANGTLGQGVAIEPSGTTISAPCDGTLSVVFATGHAFGLSDDQGMEYLIHVGIDTVKLKGEGFQLLVEQGQKVKKGDPLVNVDFELIKKNNYATDTILIVTTNKEDIQFQQIAQNQINVNQDTILFRCELKK